MLWTGLERARDLVEVSLPPAAGLTQDLFLLPTSLSSTPPPRRPVCDSSMLLCLKKRFHLGRIYVRGTQEGVVGWDSLSPGVKGPSGRHCPLPPSVPLHPSPWAGC